MPMSVSEYCNRKVVIAAKDIGIREAARLMHKFHVGDLVIVERIDAKNVPIGTDLVRLVKHEVAKEAQLRR